MNDVFEKIREEDLTPDLQIVADVCGMETVRKLIRHCQGLSFYIPRLSRLESFIRERLKEYPSMSFKQLASELRVSEQYLRRMYNSR